MPGARNLPARSSLRRNIKQDEGPMRTRSTRGSKGEKTDVVTPTKSSPNHANGHLMPTLTRKPTRSSSNISNHSYSSFKNVAGHNVYAEYEHPFLMVYGLSRDFQEGLEQKGKFIEKPQRKSRQLPRPESHLLEDLSPSGALDTSDESDEPAPARTTPRGRGRGRGGRGSRGGRGNRGRGRGRVRGVITRDISPRKVRTRNAAHQFPFVEDDDEDSTNQESATEDAKESIHSDDESDMSDTSEDDEQDDEPEQMEDVQVESTTPPGSPPAEVKAHFSKSFPQQPQPSIPQIKLLQESTTQTPQDGTPTPAEPAAQQLLDPNEDILVEADLPGPWIQDYCPPKSEKECDDQADYLLKTRFKPMADPQIIIAALTKFKMAERSTENLFRLAENTQKILKAWQDEYLILDARTAPHAHPPKKPANGGRVPVAVPVFEDMKEADIYGYTFDPKKPPGTQDPFTQRVGSEKVGGRELRQRRTREMLGSAAPSEDEEDEENVGRAAGRRQRRATRRFEVGEPATGATTPKRNGWGGARKKGVSKYAQPASETPELEGRPAKRQKISGNLLLHQRIQEMREESVVTSSADEASSNANSQDGTEPQPNAPVHKRGRPAGSKNVSRRSDYGIKKGPRKKNNESVMTPASVQSSSIPPTVLQSLSEGQNQFPVDPHPLTPAQGKTNEGTHIPPVMAPQSVSGVFHATPHPQEIQGVLTPLARAPTPPEGYVNKMSRSQYSNPQMDDSSGTPVSGSKRKPRVKSEKRSQSMTIWWAERKARQKELEEKTNSKVGTLTPRTASRKGGKGSTSEHQHLSISRDEPASGDPSPVGTPIQPLPPPREIHTQSPLPYPQLQVAQFYASSPSPTNQMMPTLNPLAALPSGPPPGPPQSRTGGMPPLAPAPMPPQPQLNYPSPFGPRTAPRPKSSGPPPLAPAPPAHISPYPPMGQGPMQPHREMPFKVMVPGTPPGVDGGR
ncbi:hypothetical protein CC78DRAFT_186321 [Lojkania enalia]|uniref:Uncharacterized protein n=1 Tax=Lojkania enalia TaxID=147567 RepID=A0A9P4KD66_9PLEO|nr:hypothetical protein CC78DRAFT_186321 [Didymosphaeria enalia]